MESKIFLLGVIFTIFILLQINESGAAKADPRDCEVCISVMERFINQTSEKDFKNEDMLEASFERFCKGLKGRDHKLCYYLGAVENAPTRIVRKAVKPLSFRMPAKKVCEKLKADDGEICALRYEKQIDLASTNLKKLRVNELKKILAVWGEDNSCKGCTEKGDYIRLIEQLMLKYDPEAAKKRAAQQKTEL